MAGPPGGFLLATGLGVNSNFLAFAGAAAIAAILLWVIMVRVKASAPSTTEKTNTTPARDVLVIGDGMAGLADALALRENGATVTLVENAPAFGEVGAGLQMASNASRVLKRWGLLEKALEIGVQPKRLVFRDAVIGVFVEKVETDGDKARDFAANGDVYEADAVLAADGLKSTLRKVVSEDVPLPSSYFAYRGTVPIPDATPEG
ncbi:MAG: FAD-binding protein [Specibacter sp.]